MVHQLLIVVLLGLVLGAADARAVGANISGTWAFVVDIGEPKPFNQTFVFKQEGAKLSGAYSGGLGERQVIGTVKGDKVVFGFEVTGAGAKGSATATFTGTIESPTKMTGTVGNPFCGNEGCKWTSTKKK